MRNKRTGLHAPEFKALVPMPPIKPPKEETKRKMTIKRVWAMPSSKTFTIKPIKELVERYVKSATVIIDPFANSCKYGTITNDLNPEFDTTYHLDALEFLKTQANESGDLVLYDPPYSISQAAEMYKAFGKEKLEVNVVNMKYWASCKTEVARILKPNGVAICCGWNSNGVGINRGFEMIEMLIVAHGGSKNDTIVTVEQKSNLKQIDFFENYNEKLLED